MGSGPSTAGRRLIPMRMLNPKSSSLVIFSQAASPMTSLTYRLVCSTMSTREGVNMSSKTSEGDAMVGSTGCVKSLLETKESARRGEEAPEGTC